MCIMAFGLLSLAEDGHVERSQERAHSAVGSSLGLALDGGGRAHGARAGRGGRARLRRRALDFGATSARAGRALASLLGAGRGVYDDRLLLGNTALQNIPTEVRHRRALGLQHVLCEVRALRARGYGRLENVLAHIGLFAGRADELAYATATTAATAAVAATAATAAARASTSGSRALTISAHGDNVLKSLLDLTTHIGTEAESYS